ncbi:META domain-containing protein [Pararhodobacter sp. SW119]|uniref:META domain-containing protein n=1 Tax=Pararhodobacter sp. SW119 TaxID=2780075 RepID=UPI001ADFB5A7|nr:META domain-containing protein [Pararhodobacter sp. SW119]
MANGGGSLDGTSWQVSAVGELQIEPADDVTLRFQNGRISGRSGCNQYTGPVSLGPENIDVGAIAGTRMACPGRASEIERSFLAALDAVTGWRVTEEGTLELTAEGAPTVRALAP